MTTSTREQTIAALRTMVRKLDTAVATNEWDLETVRILGLAEDIAAWMDQRPRTWELPTEPDPKVTHVRDRDGRVWRQPDLGLQPDRVLRQWRTLDDQLAFTWPELLAGFGPLTDVSAEYR